MTAQVFGGQQLGAAPHAGTRSEAEHLFSAEARRRACGADPALTHDDADLLADVQRFGGLVWGVMRHTRISALAPRDN